MVSMNHPTDLSFYFGICGNIVSFMVFMAPLPTFIRIYKKKSTEGFQSIPYSVSLFSAMLYLYYAYIKGNMVMLLTINGIGCFVQGGYLLVFMIYATTDARIFTTKLLIGFNLITYGIMAASTYAFSHGDTRVSVVGWICSVFSVLVFAAPLSIIMKVIRTKSVEFLPISLSFCLTLCAVMWFFYGFLIRDYYIATPNILGFLFGLAQMILYVIYKTTKKVQPESDVREIEAAPVKAGESTIEINLKEIEGATVRANNGEEMFVQIEIIADALDRV